MRATLSLISNGIKKCLLLGRKAMTNQDKVLKSKGITLSTKVHIVKAMVFPVVMYKCERWTIKKTECWNWFPRTVMLDKSSRIPWTAMRSNQSILKEINPEYSLEWLMLKLKLQYFGHLMQRDNSLKETLMLGKIEGKRRRGQQRMRWLDSINDSMDMRLSKFREIVKDREAWHATVREITEVDTIWQLNKNNKSKSYN